MRLGHVGVRSLRLRDASAWQQLRGAQVDWLGPWEATLPPGTQVPFASHRAMVRAMLARAKDGQSMPFVVTWDGAMVGLLTVNGITLGSSRSANLGYWIARTHAGRGIIPSAVAMVCDHLFDVAALHRIEIAIRPDNPRSLRVVENNHGYLGPTSTLLGNTTKPGLERIDVDPEAGTCTRVWRSDEIAPSVVPKVSLEAGLLYTYTKPRTTLTDPWYFTAIDFRTGRTIYQRLAGSGLGFNNNYAPISIGPDGTAYVGVLGGLVALRDGS